jgi:hypothetical protein
MHRIALAALAAVAVVVSASGATPSPRAVPVIGCRARLGAEGLTPPPIPTRVQGAVSARAASQLRFFSDGFVTVLGPRSWTCSGLAAADGGLSLSVFPAHQPDPLRANRLPSNTVGVTVFVDYTGHGPGAQLVCTLFPGTRAAALAAQTGGCAAPAPGEIVRKTNTGLAQFEDPPGVKGVGVPSGGANRAVGAVLYPQGPSEPDSVTVTKLTCTAPPSTIGQCRSIVDDYLIRAPVTPRERAVVPAAPRSVRRPRS